MRRCMLWSVAAVAGVLLVAAITAAASTLSTQTIGLSSEPLTAGDQLAPRATATATPAKRRQRRPKRTPTPTPRPVRTATPAPTVAPGVDDNSGHGGGSDDSGGDDSGGHGSGGHGSDD